MKNIIISFVIFGICVGIFLSLNTRKYANFAESSLDSTLPKQKANSSIVDEFLRLREASDADRTNSSSRKRGKQRREKSPQDEFAYLPNSENSAHSSSLADFGDRLLVAYFAGSKEGASDVKIMAHFVDKRTLHSTPPREILSAQTLSILSGKFIKKLGNPLIFKSADGALHFFVVGVSLGGWATSKIYHLQLSDDLETLKLRKELRLGLLGNFSHLVRTPPLMLENGGFMLPLYHELARKYPLVAFFDENGEFSYALRLNYLKNQLQPTIIALNESECLAFFRNHKAYQNASFLQKCERGGAIWEAPNTTNLKAWDDSSLLLHYKNAEQKSRILLLYNDGKLAESSNSRRSLGLYYLVNSAKFAESALDSAPKSQKDAKFVFLQNIDIVDEAYPNEVSYPSAVIDENALFVGYTYNRKGIKVRKIELAEIERLIDRNSYLDNSVLGMQFRTCGNFRTSTDLSLVDSPKISTNTKATPQSLPLRFCESQNLIKNNPRTLVANPCKSFCYFWLSPKVESPLPFKPNLPSNADSADLQNLGGNSEKNAESTINYDIFGIYLLFLSAFFFLTKSLSKRVKYLALPCFVALISIPFIFVLWDYYSIVNLFYSLFGGTSLFCALLCAKYILREVLQACRFCESQNLVIFFEILRFAQNDKCKGDSANSRNLAFTLALFSIPLFLGHLGLVNFDILRSEIASAIFVSTFIVALFWVDKWASIFALIALILTKSLFGLFDGYLLIFSVVYCVIWATKWIFKKIIAQA